MREVEWKKYRGDDRAASIRLFEERIAGRLSVGECRNIVVDNFVILVLIVDVKRLYGAHNSRSQRIVRRIV